MGDLLSGKTALVTGAGGGIGRAVVDRFQSEGARVCAVDRGDDGSPGDLFVQADVTDPAQVENAVRAAQELGCLDICVANAGVMANGLLLETDRAQWREVIEVNLLGVMTTFRAAAAVMVDAGAGGRLLATSSTAGLRAEGGSAAYCASKAGVIAVVQAAALELAAEGITVNAVAPGEIDTVMNAMAMRAVAARQGRSDTEVRLEMLEQRIPLKRMGRPAEVAGVLAFLASDQAAYITGEVVRVDGGQLNV
jgi:NAD(P)-dependent dehydrogenase (short-subunit alcohol dehydrogenase family)